MLRFTHYFPSSCAALFSSCRFHSLPDLWIFALVSVTNTAHHVLRDLLTSKTTALQRLVAQWLNPGTFLFTFEFSPPRARAIGGGGGAASSPTQIHRASNCCVFCVFFLDHVALSRRSKMFPHERSKSNVFSPQMVKNHLSLNSFVTRVSISTIFC